MQLNSKEKGSSGVLDLFPIILAVLFVAYFFINFGYYIKYLDTLSDLDNISRKYMLIMETSGGMTEDDLKKLYQELGELGIDNSDVDVSGTTFCNSDVQYGDDIYFQLTVWVPCQSFVLNEDMSVNSNEMKREVRIFKCAIALS